jgi:hypothetical protein
VVTGSGFSFDDSGTPQEPPINIVGDDKSEVATRSGPPLLVAGGACVLLGAGLAVPDGPYPWFIGYALASIVAFVLVALHRRRVVAAAARAGEAVARQARVTPLIIVGIGALVAFVHAWRLADLYA